MAYIAFAASRVFAETGVKPGFLIPTGNLGHGFAAVYARALGFPVGPIVLVTNANRTLWDWHGSGRYDARASVPTIANAMDVGAPSNFERLVHLPPQLREVDVQLVEDEAIRARITAEYRSSGYVWCPHSAAAAEAYALLPKSRREERSWIAAATAHPFKFSETVEPLIGRSIEAPAPLADILRRKAVKVTIPADLEALARVLEGERVLA
jgi:threonine synthase